METSDEDKSTSKKSSDGKKTVEASKESKKTKDEEEEEACLRRQLRSRNRPAVKEYVSLYWTFFIFISIYFLINQYYLLLLLLQHLKPEEYFAKQSEKSITSNHTLSKLKNRHMDEEQLQKLLASNSHISDIHKKRIELFTKSIEASFVEWYRLMK